MMRVAAVAGEPESGRRLSPARPSAWVLLRGLGRERRHWFDFVTTASDVLGVECHALDLPGFGEARFERVPTTVAKTAEALLHRITRLPHEGATGVIGLSLGGMVGLELCRQAPERFSHLVVVNSSASISPPWQRLRPEGMRLLASSLASGDALEREHRIYDLTLAERRGNAAEYASRAAEFTRVNATRRRDIVRQLYAAARFRPAPVGQPVLVLSGRNDRLVSPSCSAALAALLGAVHVEHPTAGHDLPIDDGAWLAKQIEQWLARDSSGARQEQG
jgi:pimeloyl-ACP methyl ester carboxylesterase